MRSEDCEVEKLSITHQKYRKSIYLNGQPKKNPNHNDNKFMRKLMNIVFYISVSFLCTFTKISISEANT